jgi:hypothetical protein
LIGGSPLQDHRTAVTKTRKVRRGERQPTLNATDDHADDEQKQSEARPSETQIRLTDAELSKRFGHARGWAQGMISRNLQSACPRKSSRNPTTIQEAIDLMNEIGIQIKRFWVYRFVKRHSDTPAMQTVRLVEKARRDVSEHEIMISFESFRIHFHEVPLSGVRRDGVVERSLFHMSIEPENKGRGMGRNEREEFVGEKADDFRKDGTRQNERYSRPRDCSVFVHQSDYSDPADQRLFMTRENVGGIG